MTRPIAAGPANASGASPFYPTQVQQAYGVNALQALGDNGAGQTIAIIDAYDYPNALSTLNTFCQGDNSAWSLPQMTAPGGAGPTFTQLNQSGGTALPGSEGGQGNGSNWEYEEALDIEYAHAMAPMANIILYEANNASTLYTAVSAAKSNPAVSVISMSWGANEFGGEASNDAAYFTTPGTRGNSGVTFCASTGDKGAPGGYPAFSPNVVAVGGTSLYLTTSNNYSSETAWSWNSTYNWGGGGGTSTMEPKPAYQSSYGSANGGLLATAQSRATPDVSMVADPLTGVYTYDSYNGGWIQGIGGTSLAAPCFAGLVAISNQIRAKSGYGSLDGPSQTLPALYAASSSDFNDITSGNISSSGDPNYSAGPGYDLATGLGSPKANLLVPALAFPPLYWDPGGTGTTNGGGSGTWSTTGANTMTWFNFANDVAWAPGGDAYFGGASGGTVTLTVSVSADKLFFTTAGYTITGNSLTLTGGAVNMAASTGTIASVLAGTGGLTTTGSGTIVLNAANIYTGGTTIAGGVLQAGNNAALGPSSAPLTVNAGTLDVHGFSLNVGAIGGSGTIDNLAGSGSLTLGNGGASGTFSGTIQNTAGQLAVTKVGLGTLLLTGANSYTGGTTVSGGVLLLSGAVNMPGSGTLTVNAGGTFSLADGAPRSTTVPSMTLAGGSVLAFDWIGAATDTLILTSSASTSGNVGISINSTGTAPSNASAPYTLIQSSAGGLSGATYFVANNSNYIATVNASDTAVTISSYAAATTMTNAYWLGGQLAGAGNAMAFSNGTTSNWALNLGDATPTAGGLVPGPATNVFFSATANAQSSIVLGAGMTIKSLTFNSTGTTLAGDGNALTLVGSGAGAASAISANTSATIDANLVLGTNQTWTTAIGATLAVGGAISGSGSLTVAGGGTVALGAANSYAGTTLSSGLLLASNTSALGTAGSAGLQLNGGTLDLATNTTIGAYNTTVGGAATILSDLASGGSGITHTLGTLSIGAYQLNLAAGGNVSGGTAGLTFGATTFTGAPTFSIGSGALLTLGAVADGGNTATLSGAGNFAQTGVLSGSGGLTLNSGFSGAATLSQANTYTGATTVNGGMLVAANAAALGTAGGAPLQLNGGTLGLATNTTIGAYNTTVGGSATILSDRASGGSGINQTLGTLSIGAFQLSVAPGGNVSGGTAGLTFGATTFTGAPTFSIGSGAQLTLGAAANGGNTATLAGAGNFAQTGVFSGSGGLTLNSLFSGAATLSQPNTYTGATTVDGGTLTVTNSTGLGPAVNAVIAFGAGSMGEVQIQNNVTVAGLSSNATLGSPVIQNGSGSNYTLTVNNAAPATYGGIVRNGAAGSLGLRLSGGTLSLYGVNTYTGTTTISGGVLAASNSAALGKAGSASVQLNGGALDLATNSTIGAYNTTVGGTATILSDLASPGDGINQTMGTLSIGAFQLNVAPGRNVSGGTAGLTFGATTFTGSPTFSIASGALLTLGAVANGGKTATITGAGNFGQTGAMSGAGGLTLNGGFFGTATLSQSNNYTGTTTLAAGKLMASNTAAPGKAGSAPLQLNGGTLDLATNTTIGAYNSTVGGTATIVSDRASPGSGINQTLGTLSIGAYQLNVAAGGNINAGSAGLTFGATTFTGAPTFAIGSGAQLTLGAIANGGNTATISGAGNFVQTGVFSGSGGLTQEGAGKSTLSGSNTFSGQLSVLDGTVASGTINNSNSAGPLGKGTLPVVLGSNGIAGVLEYTGTTAASTKPFTMAGGGIGAFQIDNAATALTLSGSIYGGGGLAKWGPGTLVLSPTGGANSWGGGTSISNGTLQLGNANALPLTTALIFGSPSTGGVLDLNGVNATVAGLAVAAGASAASQVIGNSSTSGIATLSFAPLSSLAATFGGVIQDTLGSGNRQTQLSVSSGTLQLTGPNSYTGGTMVSGALLLGSGGFLGNTPVSVIGSGVFGTAYNTSGNTINGGATLSLAIGATLNMVDGFVNTLKLGSGTLGSATLKFDLGSAASDELLFTGPASLTGTSTIGLASLGSLSAGSTYTLISASGGLNPADFNLSSNTVSANGTTLYVSLGGNSTQEQLTVTGSVASTSYSLAATAAVAAIHVSGSATITATLANTGGGASDSLTYGGVGLLASGGTLSGGTLPLSSGTLATSGSSTASGTATFSSNTAGSFTITPTAGPLANLTVGVGPTLSTSSAATVAVYRLAAPAVANTSINLGNVHVSGTFGTAPLTVQNNATADGYSESLDASIAASGGSASASSGPISLLPAGSSDTTSLTVGLGGNANTGTAGPVNGSATVTFTSDGTGTSGLGTTGAGSATLAVSGAVYRLAAPALVGTSINLGNVHVGGTFGTLPRTVQNNAIADGYSEGLDASIAASGGSASASGGPISLLPAGSSDTTSLTVGLSGSASTGSAGPVSGMATVTFTSDGTGTSGLGTTSLGSATVAVSGAVYRLAAPAVAGTSINLGNVHVGGTFATQPLTVQNNATTDGYSEGLDASIAASGGSASASGGPIILLPAGSSDTTSLTVGLSGSANTGTPGPVSGTATVTFTSDGTGTSGLGTTSLGSATVAVSGAVYRLAAPAVAGTSINLGTVHVGGTFGTQPLTVQNNATADGYSEGLDASIASTGGSASAGGGPISLLLAGSSDTTSLTVGLSGSANTSTPGPVSGTATVTFTSDGTGTSGLGLTSLGSQTITITGNVFSGSAVWNGTSGSWGSGSPAANWTGGAAPGTFGGFSNSDTAALDGLGATSISLSGTNPSLKTLVFSGTNYTLSDGTLTLASDDSSIPTIDVTGGTGQQISSTIAGTQGLLKDGSGMLVLSGSNTYTGGTYVAAGTLMVNNLYALPDGSSLTVGADAFTLFSPAAAAPIAWIAVSQVPEPGTLALLTAAVCGAAAYRCVRRQRKQFPTHAQNAW